MLVLSEFAGAAQALGAGCVRVNPYNTEERPNPNPNPSPNPNPNPSPNPSPNPDQVAAELRGDEFFVDGHAGACRVPAELGLKLGAQVMLLRNEAPGGFVNGDTGLVV